MVKRKLNGAADEYLQQMERFINRTRLYITCEKSGGLHLVESGLKAGRQAGWLADKIWVRLEIFKAYCRLKY